MEGKPVIYELVYLPSIMNGVSELLLVPSVSRDAGLFFSLPSLIMKL